jgi:hypothetical protein
VDIENEDLESSPEKIFQYYTDEFRKKSQGAVIIEVIDQDHNLPELFNDLGVSLENADSFIVCYIFRVSAIARITKEEFLRT